MIGEVVEKKRARQIYESYKRTRRDPGLLEQVDYKTFEMWIFPIGPEAQQRVSITYYQLLDFDNDWATYVYPLATSPRSGMDSQSRSKFGLSMQIKSAVPIAEMESPSHGEEFVIAQHTANLYEASLESSGGDLNRDVVLAFRATRPRTGIDVITSKQSGEDGYVALTLTAGDELSGEYTGMDFVFILDISGSMATDGKLRLSRNSIAAFVDSLGQQDRFELITFNVRPNTLFGQLQSVNAETQTEAIDFLRAQQGRGGTNLKPAVSTAYKYGNPDRPLNVVILSDGMTEQKERSQLLSLIGSRPSNCRVFCVGVGNDVNRPLLSQLADDAGGLAAFISNGDNFERQAKSFRRKLLRPVAANVQISFDGGDVYDIEPKQLPNLYHGMPVRLFGRYRGNGSVKVRIQAELNGAPLDQSVSIDLPRVDNNNPEIERMWASKRIDQLRNQADRNGSRTGVVNEIVRLGEGYSIVSEYTSFIVLENDAEYRRWKIDLRNAQRIARDRTQQQAVQAQLAALRDKALDNLGPAQEKIADQVAQAPVSPAQRASRGATPAQSSPRPVPNRSRNKRDIDFRPSLPNVGGGGAFDPITCGIVLSLAGLGLATRCRKDS